MSDLTRIILEQRGPVSYVTMNRPEVHNAFDEALIREMIDVFNGLASDGQTRVAVLLGAGASFSAGADLEWMQRMAGYTHEQNLADAAALQEMFDTIARAPFVTIAKVHGAAIGGGVGLVAVCDVAIAEDTQRLVPAKSKQFGLSEVRLGLAPAVIAPYILRKISPGVAHSLFLTGRRFTAEEAYAIGLVQQVVEPGQIDRSLAQVVEDVLMSGPEAVAATKKLMYDIEGKSPAETAALTTECIATLRSSPEGQEGISAFLQKRHPSFSIHSEAKAE
jgi:methylglutaconyl-CoA hydratase